LTEAGVPFHTTSHFDTSSETEFTLLNTAAVKISLDEPKKKFLEMITCLQSYGTTRVHLIHIRTKSRYIHREKAESRLEELSEEVAAMGFKVTSHIQNGHAPSLFVELAESLGTDYLCLFWRPKGLLSQTLLGSIDSDILRISNLPVFIYKPRLFTPAVELNQVLYATDFRSTDAAAMPYLVDSRFKAETLYLLHVGDRAPDPVTDKARREEVLDNLRSLAAQCKHAYGQVEVIETIGLVSREITRQARTNNADLVVVGKSEKPDAMARFVGSTAEILPHKIHCSVFIIPSVCSLPTTQDDER
jgi:nucleotide-binding universal stress UspA family protein